MTRSKAYLWALTMCLLAMVTIYEIRPNSQAQGLTKMTWEYKVITVKATELVERPLNQLGSEGWELVQVLQHGEDPGGTGGRYILKRAK